MSLLTPFFFHILMVFHDGGSRRPEWPLEPQTDRWFVVKVVSGMIGIMLGLLLIGYCPPTFFIMLAIGLGIHWYRKS